MSAFKLTSAPCAIGSTFWSDCFTTSSTACGRAFSSSLPASIFEMSRMSLMIRHEALGVHSATVSSIA